MKTKLIQILSIVILIFFSVNNLVAQENPPGSLKITQDSRIDTLMEKYKALDEKTPGMIGFRIQIYSGSGTNARKEAHQIEADFLRNFPDTKTYIIYNEPYFKTRVGNFRTKAEGYKLFKEISRYFPNCYYVIEQNMDFPALKNENEQ